MIHNPSNLHPVLRANNPVGGCLFNIELGLTYVNHIITYGLVGHEVAVTRLKFKSQSLYYCLQDVLVPLAQHLNHTIIISKCETLLQLVKG
jgi:hypothetical protein